MPLSHRPAEERDLARVCTFARSEEELFFMYPRADFPLSVEQLRLAALERADSTVVERDGEVVGFANIYQWETGGRCTIGNVIVSPAARGCGVGSYLIGRMIELALGKYRAAEVGVACFNHNVAGLLLYPQLGFRPYAVEERRDREGKRVALIHMRLPRGEARGIEEEKPWNTGCNHT